MIAKAAGVLAGVLLDGDAARLAAYHQAVGRLDALTTALSRPTPPVISTVARHPAGEPVRIWCVRCP